MKNKRQKVTFYLFKFYKVKKNLYNKMIQEEVITNTPTDEIAEIINKKTP